MDVLRAVPHRTEHRHGAILDGVARQDTRRTRREADREERRAATRRSTCSKRNCAIAPTWSPIATRSPTLRSSRTRTSRTKAASISRRIRDVRAWCDRVCSQPRWRRSRSAEPGSQRSLTDGALAFNLRQQHRRAGRLPRFERAMRVGRIAAAEMSGRHGSRSASARPGRTIPAPPAAVPARVAM